MKRRCQKNDRIVNTFLTTVPKQQAPNSKAINKKTEKLLKKGNVFLKKENFEKTKPFF